MQSTAPSGHTPQRLELGGPSTGRRVAYTVREVALLLGLSRGSTYALVREGRIPALRMGGRWIVPKRRFHAWLDARPETAELQSEAAP